MPAPPVLLLTRPAEANLRFLGELRQAGVEMRAICSALLRIEPVVPEDAPDGDLVFTSQQAVAPFVAAFGARGHAWCVGARTAAVAQAAGFTVTCAEGTARALEARILAEGGQGPFTHICGDQLAYDLVAGLRARGRAAKALQIYRQLEQAPTPEAMAVLSGEAPVLVPLFSPRSAAIFTKYLPKPHAPLYLGAISTTVSRQLTAVSGAYIGVSRETHAAAMVALVKALASRSVAS
ncbi:uroporphyrinogen-III synthase [Thioclava sp. GXIMD2076]|uniref:Uroporphyrinogen-III synthase n=1 Tax=Thioclava kandeliae TaxID=3070818 RepID=A0ABV1SH47_9RHOB